MMSKMNTAVQIAANAIYERARSQSANTMRTERRDFAHVLALRHSLHTLPLSGPEFQNVVQISGHHIERCIQARFDSYRQAFREAEVVPTDQEFREILNGVNSARDQEISAGDVVVTSVSCFVGLALLTTKFITWDQTKNLSRRRTANAAVIVGAVILLLGVIDLAKKRLPPPPPEPLITMQISPTSLPLSIPPHTVASILQMHPYIGMTEDRDELLKVANDTGREGCWPKRAELATLGPNGHEEVYRVEITNHSERTVEGGKAKFGIKYNVGLKGGGCMAPSDQRPDQYDVVLIPPLDPGKTFEFYATNPSNSCAWLLPPGSAAMKIAGQEKVADVPLVLDKNPLYSAGAPSFSPTAIKWEGVPTHPNGPGVIRTGSESCEAIPSTASSQK